MKRTEVLFCFLFIHKFAVREGKKRKVIKCNTHAQFLIKQSETFVSSRKLTSVSGVGWGRRERLRLGGGKNKRLSSVVWYILGRNQFWSNCATLLQSEFSCLWKDCLDDVCHIVLRCFVCAPYRCSANSLTILHPVSARMSVALNNTEYTELN